MHDEVGTGADWGSALLHRVLPKREGTLTNGVSTHLEWPVPTTVMLVTTPRPRPRPRPMQLRKLCAVSQMDANEVNFFFFFCHLHLV